MNIHILGATTLRNFTDTIRSGFAELGIRSDLGEQSDFILVQIHGSPAAVNEDEGLIKRVKGLKARLVFLIHRPDEVLLRPSLKAFFAEEAQTKLIFLGDLIFRFPFWAERRAFSRVIPHPQIDFLKPELTEKLIVGSYTSWGEMRNANHFFELTRHLAESNVFDFKIGGSGLNESEIPNHIQYSKESFLPHFNVQLYHLHGQKRYGESSGSIHRGISVPVIFEANGAERLERMKMIRIEADDELRSINFAKAASEIIALAESGIIPILEANMCAAKVNCTRAFASNVLRFLES